MNTEQTKHKDPADEVALSEVEIEINDWRALIGNHISDLIKATQVEALKPNEIELAIARCMQVELRLILFRIKLHQDNNHGVMNPAALSSLLAAMMSSEDDN